MKLPKVQKDAGETLDKILIRMMRRTDETKQLHGADETKQLHGEDESRQIQNAIAASKLYMVDYTDILEDLPCKKGFVVRQKKSIYKIHVN